MLTILFKQFGQLSLAVFTFSLVLPAVSAQQATSGSAVSPVPVTVTKTVTVCSHRPHSTFITSRKHHTEKSSSPTTTSSPNTSITSHTVSPASSCTSTPSVTTDGYTLTGFVEIKPTVTLDSYEVAPRVVMGHRITYTDYDVATDMRAYVENACQFQCVAFCRSFSVYYQTFANVPGWRCELYDEHMTPIQIVPAESSVTQGAIFDAPCSGPDPTSMNVTLAAANAAQMDYPS